MSEIIAVDIDDTLYDFNTLAREIFAELASSTGEKQLKRGAYCAWTEWRTPADVTGDWWPEVIDRCHADESILSRTPYPMAYTVLHELKAAGFELRYISGRKEEATTASHLWLAHHDFPQGTVVCNHDDKIPQIWDCRYVIDDRPQTLVQFVYDFHWQHKHGTGHLPRMGFGLHTPYNAALTDVPGIQLAPNWKLLRQSMVEEGLLAEKELSGTPS